jgi:hypothetical protein
MGLLKCKISPGQFTDEYAVSGEMFDGEGFSLFAYKEDLECSEFPEGKTTVPGLIRVQILDEEEGLMLVRLPQRALENGDTVTVRADHVQIVSETKPLKA